MITKWEQELPMVVEDNLWTLGSPTTISKMGSLNASTATNMDIWQKNANWRRKNMKQGPVLNAKRKGISPETAKTNRQ